MRWLRSNSGWLILYGIFFVSAGNYACRAIRYSGVETWPSVEARNLSQTGTMDRYSFPARYGQSLSVERDGRVLNFDYTVDGRTYSGHRFSPDEGGAPDGWQTVGWRAFYKPSAPERAVLHPAPFVGIGWFLFGTISGLMVLVHAGCAVDDFRIRKRKESKEKARLRRALEGNHGIRARPFHY